MLVLCSYLFNVISGLYMWPDDVSTDSVRLIVPYTIGQNGSVVDGNPGRPDVQNDGIYQRGEFLFFSCRHGLCLFTILDNWTKRVKSGQWTVGWNGVKGRISDFKRADTAVEGEQYCIGACFDEDL